ncbi:hypothetical protein [Rhodococcoides fascians]|nr:MULTISPECIES: hypothetical protein [Rhodococcus]
MRRHFAWLHADDGGISRGAASSSRSSIRAKARHSVHLNGLLDH